MRSLASATILILLSSCGMYKYNAPTANTAVFTKSGEVQVEGNLGSSGANAKFAVALPANIGVTGMYNSSFEGDGYQTDEYEFGAGYYQNCEPSGFFALGGLGFGNNYYQTSSGRNWEGSFYRPFVQFNYGNVIDPGESGGIVFETVSVFKVSNFIYDGTHFDTEGTSIESNYWLIEPAFSIGLGSKNFQFRIISGFPLRPAVEGLSEYRNARTTPGNIDIGIKFYFGRVTM